MIKLFILAAFVFVVISLGSALFHLVRAKGDSKEQMARALTVRITLSIVLIGFILLAGAMGWIAPHSLLPVPAQPG